MEQVITGTPISQDQSTSATAAISIAGTPSTEPHLHPLAGIASTGLAALRGDRPLAPHLTAWDEAALLFALSLGLHLWLGPIPAS